MHSCTTVFVINYIYVLLIAIILY